MKYPCEEAPRAPCPPQDAAHSRWVLIATILGSSMAFIDGTVVNVALPVLQEYFHATAADVLWVVESYALFLSALILTGGAMGDHYGRRLIFGVGVVLFAVASALCGGAPNVQLLIYSRALQGIGAALLVPGSLALISANFSSESRGRAIGTWSAFTGITSAIGPTLGGWMVQHLSWRSVFLLNVPFAIVVLGVLFWRVPESKGGNSKQRLDYAGALLITAFLGTLVYAFIAAPHAGWGNPLVLGCIAAAALSLIMLLWRERADPSPLIPFRLFASRDFSGANLLTLTLYAALGAMLFFLPFDLIQVQGYTPTQAGFANLPLILILFVLSRYMGALTARLGSRLLLVAGALLSAAGFLLMARPAIGGSYWTTFFPAILVLGLGMSGVVAPLTTTVMNSVPQADAGTASGINNAVSRIASLLSIAVLGMVVTASFSSRLEQKLHASPIPQPAQQSLLSHRERLTETPVPKDLPQPQQQQVRRMLNESYVAAFRRVMLLSAVLAALSALAALAMIGRAQPVRLH